MGKEFIPYEQALELKELGFNEECFRLYNQNDCRIELPLTPTTNKNSDRILYASKRITAPLFQQAFRWFREKYNMHFFAQYFTDGKWRGTHSKEDFDTYEEAELACLKKLIEIAKNK